MFVVPSVAGEHHPNYSLYSDGSALLENQPHMRAGSSSDGQTLKFAMDSIDNLPSKDADHMDAVVFTFNDADHFTAQWRSTAAGKSSVTPFEFTRVR
jgi:hypothetical protein